MQNWTETLLSQYANACTIVDIIKNLNECIDPTVDIQNIYSWVWDLDTAQGFGLDNWGKILVMPRNLTVLGTTYTLDDPTYRAMLYVKALSNITATNSPSLNTLLRQLFGDQGRAYTVDVGDMHMLFVFEFALSSTDLSILQNTGIMPHPAGVKYDIVQVIDGHPAFGLDYESNFLAGPDVGYLT